MLPSGPVIPDAALVESLNLGGMLGAISISAMLATLVALVIIVAGLGTEYRTVAFLREVRRRGRRGADAEGLRGQEAGAVRRLMQREGTIMASPRPTALQVADHLRTFTDLDDLLHYAAERARELFDAEACALILLDRRRRKLHVVDARPDGGSAPLLLEASATRIASLCAPLRTRSETLGVVEVVDPRHGHFTTDDRELLEALAGDIAVICERALVDGDFRPFPIARTVSTGLIAIGLALTGGAIWVHQALALPLSELPMRPGMWLGPLSVVSGAMLCTYRSRGRTQSAGARRAERSAAAVADETRTASDVLDERAA